MEEFPLPVVTSVVGQKKLPGESLVITVSGNTSVITGMMHGQADALARSFRQAKANLRASGPSPTIIQQAPSDANELAKLADLCGRGTLTNEEFAAKKAQILGL